MKIRADIVELLKAGHSDAAIARQLGVDRQCTVAPARAALGLPKHKPGPTPAGTPEDLFWKRAKPTDDGHMEWTGYRTRDGVPGLRHGGRIHTACRVAFRIANGRDPEGNVRPGCGRDGCVAPACQTDRLTRAEARKVDALYGAIFGTAS
ncbi:hypothetical protein ABTX34_11135 [Streptomyces sp. NPDC096538]|uniref:hypothetical protein n=1 Tax=Streptomyces sp. NPDC096538 TaxID=3155427 RepID=UPI003326BEA8